jgi:hypothetical protein
VAKPGDIAYWPSTYWHIAESDGSFNATWSIGMWLNRPFSEVLLETIKPLLTQKLKLEADARSIYFENLEDKEGRIENLPPILEQSLSTLLGISEGEFRNALKRFWLELASKQGFKNAPKIRSSIRLKKTDRVKGNPTNPILWSILSQGAHCLAVNGVVIELPYSASTDKTIRALNSGEECQVRENPKLLQVLWDAGAVVKT